MLGKVSFPLCWSASSRQALCSRERRDVLALATLIVLLAAIVLDGKVKLYFFRSNFFPAQEAIHGTRCLLAAGDGVDHQPWPVGDVARDEHSRGGGAPRGRV